MSETDLRDILKVNFELYKDEPNFIEYLTTLVIYLMEYEYKNGASSAPDPSQTRDPSAAHSGRPRLELIHAIGKPRKRKMTGQCPICQNNVESSKKICPYCLAMIG